MSRRYEGQAGLKGLVSWASQTLPLGDSRRRRTCSQDGWRRSPLLRSSRNGVTQFSLRPGAVVGRTLAEPLPGAEPLLAGQG